MATTDCQDHGNQKDTCCKTSQRREEEDSVEHNGKIAFT